MLLLQSFPSFQKILGSKHKSTPFLSKEGNTAGMLEHPIWSTKGLLAYTYLQPLSRMFSRQRIKLLLIGNAGVGKSALMNQYVHNRFTNYYRATIGADFFTKELRVDESLVTVQIWDTAGTERFQSLGAALYRGTDCCLLVFDVTSPSSFQALNTWHKEFLVQADPSSPEKFPFVVVANKVDAEERQVSPHQAREWCKAYNAEYYETSAKESTNVEEAFLEAIKLALKQQNLPGQMTDGESVDLLEKLDKDKKKCEC